METELYHYGVKGMKWGVRKARPMPTGVRPRGRGQVASSATRSPSQATAQSAQAQAQAQAAKKARRRKALKIGAAVAVTALAAYGAKKLYDARQDKKARLAEQRLKMRMQWNQHNDAWHDTRVGMLDSQKVNMMREGQKIADVMHDTQRKGSLNYGGSYWEWDR